MKERRDPKLSPASRQLAFTGWITGADEPQGSDQWFTPPELVESIRDFFGGEIDLDPCASPHAHVHARIAYTEEDDGLSMPWSGRSPPQVIGEGFVEIRNRFVNPPYSKPLPWIERLAALHAPWTPSEQERVSTAIPCDPGDSIALVKADPSTRAWRHAWTADAVLFFARRVQFVRHGSNVRTSAMFPAALLYWGPHAEGFDAWFADLGHVCMPTPMQIATAAVERAIADADTAVDDPIVDLVEQWPACTCRPAGPPHERECPLSGRENPRGGAT